MKLRSIARRLDSVAQAMGLDSRRALAGLRGSRRFARDARRYRSLNRRPSFRFKLRHVYPMLHEFSSEAGDASGHYFHQDLWAARLIYERRPETHMDIGSRIDGFVAHLLLFMPVTVMDVRPLTSSVVGLSFIQADATNLEGIEDNSVVSLSCLHAVEHFGLGRYGDPVDPEAPFKALRSMARVLSPGGRLYLSTPIGRERVEFNAHRVFDPSTIIETCGLELASSAAVDDVGRFHPVAAPREFSNARYSCGLFEFTKT